ncbi:MAG: hypothetical protein IIB69_14380 [Proteobacteria bacterium]|nr:hypothetical protein [Pseudomonadota bacterium]
MLVTIKYLAMKVKNADLNLAIYHAISDYWRDKGQAHNPVRFSLALRVSMAATALAECIDPLTLICAACGGGGRLAAKIGCQKCQGNGRVILQDSSRAQLFNLCQDDYMENWRDVYQAIQGILTDWERLVLIECQDRAN